MKLLTIFLVSCLTLAVSGSETFGQEEAESGLSVGDPVPSPDGSQIVFESDLDGGNTPRNLWVIHSDGSGLRKLTINYDGNDDAAAWSPDGSSLAYASTHAGISDIWTIHLDGTLPLRLTSASLTNRQPTWSPDGSRIAFVSDRGGSNDIWIMNADGSNPTRVTSLPGQENHPSFSPDGTKLVFSETSSGVAALMVVNLDGSGLMTITNGGFHDWNPRWTKFGIVFSSNRSPSAPHFQPWVIQPDGSGLKQLSTVFTTDPAISETGTLVFSDEFSAIRSGSVVSEIGTVDLQNGNRGLLTSFTTYLNPADVDINGHVDCLDLSIVKSSLGKVFGSPGFNPRADVNKDGVVDVKDIAFVASELPAGSSCP